MMFKDEHNLIVLNNGDIIDMNILSYRERFKMFSGKNSIYILLYSNIIDFKNENC